MEHRDDPQKMEQMREWLTRAAQTIEVDKDVALDLEPDLLKLAQMTAHHTSRPGTPLTAFLVGLATGQVGGDNDAMVATARAKIASLIADIEQNFVEDSK
ncbi:DUF6457 domain-containing protein [Gleimia europaea]|uniref:DUF6457 domain-containing protein n=1 Tax=Gleimia europaea ACS-120-V-Col10b TaxID=883069 RepID=A0A9W5RE45_9ACTO|nr:DUF6457 domain-containing protein [Gleimia europaea]EPD30778.1 hypothetical protein HMPREF9238_00533 [Gleimia europaea ACS-120-V-Col10b]